MNKERIGVGVAFLFLLSMMSGTSLIPVSAGNFNNCSIVDYGHDGSSRAVGVAFSFDTTGIYLSGTMYYSMKIQKRQYFVSWRTLASDSGQFYHWPGQGDFDWNSWYRVSLDSGKNVLRAQFQVYWYSALTGFKEGYSCVSEQITVYD